MSIFIFKVAALIVIFLTGYFGGKIAILLKKRQNSSLLFSLGNSFSAGIFLGAGLIHMLPDALGNYSEIIKSDFPWVFFLCAIGFLIILGLEQIFVGGHDNLHNREDITNPGITPYILTVILSFHSIITGIALGTENSLSLSIIIFIAVIAHKGSAAFALSTNLLKSDIPQQRVSSIIIFFSLMTPLGILIGSVIDRILEARLERIIEGGFDSLAAGTFLYIAIANIINHEFSIKEHLTLKVFSTALGLGLMTILAIFL